MVVDRMKGNGGKGGIYNMGLCFGGGPLVLLSLSALSSGPLEI